MCDCTEVSINITFIGEDLKVFNSLHKCFSVENVCKC